MKEFLRRLTEEREDANSWVDHFDDIIAAPNGRVHKANLDTPSAPLTVRFGDTPCILRAVSLPPLGAAPARQEAAIFKLRGLAVTSSREVQLELNEELSAHSIETRTSEVAPHLIDREM